MRFRAGCIRVCVIALAALLAATVARPVSSHAAPYAAALAPYERDRWPSFLGRLDLPESRNYALLILLPTAYPIDLTDSETARRSLLLAAAAPSSLALAKTSIGHAMVGWQCGGRRGLISKTGESQGQGLRMMTIGGWGITPLLSTYLDGKLVTPDGIPSRYRRVIAAGGASILAVEIASADCRALRRHLAGYMADPAGPARRFSLLDTGASGGDGCTSFAVTALAAAGVFRGVSFRRKVAVHEAMLGRRFAVPAGVEPYVRAAGPDRERIVPFPTLRAGPWTAGKVHAVIDVVDPELVFAAVAALRKAARAGPGWREKRALPESQARVAQVSQSVRRWAGRAVSRGRVVDPAGLSVLVLER